MKNGLLFFAALSVCSVSHAVTVAGIPPLANVSNCTVRLSSQEIRKQLDVSAAETGFCSGTLLNASTLVTAAHCVNDTISTKVSTLADIKKGVALNIAVGGHETSVRAEVAEGTASAVYSPQMETAKQRENYMKHPDVNMTKEDFVILKLKSPLTDFAGQCPQLPTQADCDDFNKEAKLAPMPILHISFYTSLAYSDGKGHIAKKIFYPSNRIVTAAVSAIDLTESGPFGLDFMPATGSLTIQTGDSGSGLVWKKDDGRSILLAVQSATSSSQRSKGFFANACRYIQHQNWKH